MRLDKLTIGSEKVGKSHQFKNLKNVTVDFDQKHWVTVVIGWNGSGKSNVLEALAIIFKEFISVVHLSTRKPRIEFSFKLSYNMGDGDSLRHIEIIHDPDNGSEPFDISVIQNSKQIKLPTDSAKQSPSNKSQLKIGAFLKDEANLPRYVFSYYSGESSRMRDIFAPYLQRYDAQLRAAKDPGLKRLFYASPVHSQFVLLAFLMLKSDDVSNFLNEFLGIDTEEGLESVLFVLREPPWPPQEQGDPRFWGAKGIVSDFLSRLYDIALAPVETERKIAVSLWNEKTLQFKYLYVKNIQALRQLVGDQSPAEFFRDLESTHVSQLIDEVRIRVKLKNNDDTVTFRELSEGEQQLLTVLGLMRFTAENESLFLLDEPDTHLNPRWTVDYLKYLEKFIGKSADGKESSHVVLTTHNPLAVAELLKEQVQILVRDKSDMKITSQSPDTHPRGMGYAGVITSELFGLDAAVDSFTLALLNEKRELSSVDNDLTEAQRKRLEHINSELAKLGFQYEMRDPVYTAYLKTRYGNEDISEDRNNEADMSLAQKKSRAKRLVEQALKKTEASGEK